jgi:hypothetical protein
LNDSSNNSTGYSLAPVSFAIDLMVLAY